MPNPRKDDYVTISVRVDRATPDRLRKIAEILEYTSLYRGKPIGSIGKLLDATAELLAPFFEKKDGGSS